MNLKHSKTLYKKGLQHLVGAVNSPVRAFGSVGGNPIFINKAKQSIIKDVDNNAYIDYVLSYGPMILGHRHPKVQKAITKALQKGYSFGASTHQEIKLAEIICAAFSLEHKIRFVNSGTEAVLSAIRLARAFSGKNKIIKFSGCYHGHMDALLVAAGSGLATFNLPSSKGVPKEAIQNTLIAEYNNLSSVQELIAKNEDIAAVILEPVAGNMGCVLPSESFIKGLRKLTKENNILLICDEVMTGFRACFGGVQKLLGITADITCLGKVIGGGFPVGAYMAKSEIMEQVAPLGKMYQAGTLSGNPIAMACGIATLQILKKENPYEKFEKIGAHLAFKMLESAKKYNINLQVNRFGSMLNPFFTSQKVINFTSAQTSDTEKFKIFFWNLIKQGIFIPPSQFETWFLATTLTEHQIQKTCKAMDFALSEVGKL